MRVLVTPELYRRDDATANGTLNDTVVGEAFAEVGDSFALAELNRATAGFTDDGEPTLDGACALSEVFFALRRRGYADTGSAGTPVFEKCE
jgi:hypothetical protein